MFNKNRAVITRCTDAAYVLCIKTQHSEKSGRDFLVALVAQHEPGTKNFRGVIEFIDTDSLELVHAQTLVDSFPFNTEFHPTLPFAVCSHYDSRHKLRMYDISDESGVIFLAHIELDFLTTLPVSMSFHPKKLEICIRSCLRGPELKTAFSAYNSEGRMISTFPEEYSSSCPFYSLCGDEIFYSVHNDRKWEEHTLKSAKVWEQQHITVLHKREFTSWLDFIGYMPNDDNLWMFYDLETVCAIVDIKNGTVNRRLVMENPFQANEKFLSFSPNGLTVVFGSLNATPKSLFKFSSDYKELKKNDEAPVALCTQFRLGSGEAGDTLSRMWACRAAFLGNDVLFFVVGQGYVSRCSLAQLGFE